MYSYTILHLTVDELEEKINEMADGGWRVHTIMPVIASGRVPVLFEMAIYRNEP